MREGPSGSAALTASGRVGRHIGKRFIETTGSACYNAVSFMGFDPRERRRSLCCWTVSTARPISRRCLWRNSGSWRRRYAGF
ncbi:protein of unknown function [Kyrpidia spormannii]|uniref:Uncharacterized protein n=1 Tax=Kyrpidia spormannii TaxID=2055160 RepID=A0A6F9E6M4_9BACL|nr:protein of unknown function [Kyrpidia spormannii]